jgi:tetratricopeptide (TPR) repeat protein
VALLAADAVRRRRRGGAAVSGASPGASRAAAGLIVTLALGGAGDAGAQSAWARGDRAFRAGQWAAAESLYAIRLAERADARVGVNLATARARAGKLDLGEEGLERLTSAAGRAGQVASYNLGTLRGGRGDYDRSLAALRKALERDPADEDARFNYEWVLERRRRPPPASGGRQQPEPRPSQPSPAPSAPQPQPQAPGPGPAPQSAPEPPRPERGMTRDQADRILGSLEQLERLEQQRVRQVRVMRERRGRDW